MLKRTIYFGNPAHLSIKNKLLWAEIKDTNDSSATTKQVSFALSDLGFIVLDHPQITITHYALAELAEQDIVVVSCDQKHLPISLNLPIYGNSLHSKRIQKQISITIPQKKQLWASIIKQKIINQAKILSLLKPDISIEPLINASKDVRSGDTTNREAYASTYYWKHLFTLDFIRDRYGDPPNHLLNYGYAIVRSSIAKAIVGSGLHPSLGLFHKNQYNAFCLADDLMEPYRPFVDYTVFHLAATEDIPDELTTNLKKELLSILTMDVIINKRTSPLMIATQHTADSYQQFLNDKKTKLKLPEIPKKYATTKIKRLS
jgi:CRISPR-associated protein Cas1